MEHDIFAGLAWVYHQVDMYIFAGLAWVMVLLGS
jgi:hypothetical protein